jgi:hypothetical protein
VGGYVCGGELRLLTHQKSNAIPLRKEVEKFFELSVNAIVEGIKNITTEADPESTVRIQLPPRR